MRCPPLALCLLAVAITSGCVSTPQHSNAGNPFDEPLAAAEGSRVRTQEPLAESVERPVVTVRDDTPGDRAQSPMPESEVQVFALGDAPYTPVSVPIGVNSPSDGQGPSQTSTQGETSQATEVMHEAQRVASTGDTDGQISLLEQAGSMGNADAYYELAKIYLSGNGVEKSSDAAVGYLNSAMSLGHPEATRVLGWLYVMGSGVSKDIPYGESLLAKAAENSVRAQREFGMALTNQRIPHLNDMERGLEYLKAASAAGDVESTKAYEAAFTPQAVSSLPEQKNQGLSPPRIPDQAAPRQTVQDGGASLEARGRSGDIEAIYQAALNWSLGRVRTDGDPQFKAYCWYSVAAARGYAPAKEEVRSLEGVRTLADKKSPGLMDACIGELNSAIDGG